MASDMYNTTNISSSLMQYGQVHVGSDLPNTSTILNISHNNFFSYLTAELKSYLHHQLIIDYLFTYIPPILLTFGIIGNVLAFIVLVRFVGRFSTYHYLYTLAVMDTLVLLSGLLKIWIKEIVGLDLNLQYGVLCKLFVFIGHFSSDVSVWLLVAVTVERMILLRSPLSISTICTRRRTKMIILTVLLISALINSHFIFTVELQVMRLTKRVNVTQCAPVHEYKLITNDLWPWIDAVIYSFSPFIIIITMNIFSLKFVVGSCKMRSALSTRQVELVTKRYQKLTIMMFVLSLSFIVLTSPINVLMIVVAIWKKLDQSVLYTSEVNLVRTIAKLLMYTKHSINFALYFWPGSQFRKQFCRTFCRTRQKRHSRLRQKKCNKVEGNVSRSV